MKTKTSFLILIIAFTMFILTGCSTNNETLTLQDKTNAEIEYIEDRVFVVVNKYVKEEYKNDEMINWKDVSDDVKKISDVLDTVILDLSEYEISNDDLIAFRNSVNNISIMASNQDEIGLITECDYLYSLLPNFLDKYSDNKNMINIMRLKSLVLSCLVFSYTDDWDSARNTINLAESKYNEMTNDTNFMKEYSNDLNKIFILLEEVKNAIEAEELELIKNKYIIFIEKV